MTNDIVSWLAQYNLAKYADTFIENEVELGDLTELSEADIDMLGLPLGPKRRLMRAIREVSEGLATDIVRGNDETQQSRSGWSRNPDDRRPVTLLFVDVCESTKLTEKLDPEDAHAALYGAVQRMAQAVEAHQGTVCRFMGDGLMAMFGVPVTFESHARTACACALAIQSSVQDYSEELSKGHGAGLMVRVGVHAGQVVALQVGDESHGSWDASGPAVPIAARMEQTATPGTVQVTASTFELVKHLFDAEPLPPVNAKGLAEPVPTVRLLGAKDVAEQPRVEGLYRLIGRTRELEQIRAALTICLREGAGQTICLRGEAGVGKTRLAQEVLHEAAGLGFSEHRVLVLDFGVGKGQAAIPALVRSLLDIPAGTEKSVRSEVADRTVAEGLIDLEQRVFLLDGLDLALPAALAVEFDSMDNAVRQRGRVELVARLVSELTARQPRLLVFEDLHWADTYTNACLAPLMRVAAEEPLILLLTMRPAESGASDYFQSDVASGSALTVHNLQRLRASEARKLAAEIGVTDEATIEACIERADGNALFLVELLRAGNDVHSLPTSVHTVVAARLSRLPTKDKKAAQVAAVLGQRFDLEPLQALLGDSNYNCKQLEAARIVRQEDGSWLFTHALVMEGILASILRETRRALHAKAAEWFTDRDLVLHARHLERAGSDEASQAYLRAGRDQYRQLRFNTALSLAEDGLALDASEQCMLELKGLVGDASMRLGNTRRAITELTSVADCTKDEAQRCRTGIALANLYRNLGQYAQALSALDAAAAGSSDAEQLVQVEFERGMVENLRGNMEAATIAYARANDHANASTSSELKALALGGLGRNALNRGREQEGYSYLQSCLELCASQGLTRIEAMFLHNMAILELFKGDIYEALALSIASTKKGPREGEIRQAMIGYNIAGQTLLCLNRLAEVRAYLDEALRLAELTGEQRHAAYTHALIGHLLVRLGKGEAAYQHVSAELGPYEHDLYFGPMMFVALAHACSSDSERTDAFKRGAALAAASPYGGSTLQYHFTALETALHIGAFDVAEAHANEMKSRIDFPDAGIGAYFGSLTSALTAAQSGQRDDAWRRQMDELRIRTKRCGYMLALPLIEQALADP